MAPVDRFWSKVCKNGGRPYSTDEFSLIAGLDAGDCWRWDGTILDSGYGQLKVKGKRFAAHRYSFFIVHGNEETPEYQIDHLCRNKRCVNPNHMEQVPGEVNRSRSTISSALNAQKTHCIRGHDNWRVNPKTGWRSCRICERMRRSTANPSTNKGGNK